MTKLKKFLAKCLSLISILLLGYLYNVESQIYGSAKDVLGQINSREYPNFSDLTNYPYYLPEKAVIGYDSPSLKENIYKVEEYNKRDIDASYYKEFQRQKEEFSEIEKKRRRNQEAYKGFIKPPKQNHKSRKDNVNKMIVKKMLEDERMYSNSTRVDINHECMFIISYFIVQNIIKNENLVIRKIESPIEAEKMGIYPVIDELDYVDRKVYKYHLRNNNGKRIHYKTSDANHLAYFYDVNANCYWFRSSIDPECLTYEEIYSKTRVDPTLNVAFDSSSYQRLPQEYGKDQECVATYKDPITRRRICIREGNKFVVMIQTNQDCLIFTIVGRNDSPLYEVDLSNNTGKIGSNGCADELLLHASLDALDENTWRNSALYMRTIYKLGDTQISAFVTPGHAKFLLLHHGKSSENIRQFFNEVRDLYVKILMNPFQEANQPILTPSFDVRVRQAARRLLLQ
ncbi:uncharacterized protein cubi_03734 [Cryptosporidium ubiquitum]|uniref:Uncharacterized protein n=1 Tax=Cryptosporidium ubiquitum TaxID=857276 RepID=A0A1J4MMI1_9CRYT|nr:uncharacterized protein cubi_03734 [Cryptosporidium ubiquitum]OII75255.1 hypothetical protein cubi_03734 [Cryptosporidium ubiquitum]